MVDNSIYKHNYNKYPLITIIIIYIIISYKNIIIINTTIIKFQISYTDIIKINVN